MLAYLQHVTHLVQQWLSISVPLVAWSWDAKGSTAESKFPTWLKCLRFGVDGDVRLALPVARQA